MVARVAIDLGLDRLFTYLVPEELERKLAVGQLLLVPFGHRTAKGFVMEILGSAGTLPAGDGKYSLKPIAEIVDETPFFSPALLRLVRDVAAYTASPVETVLRAAVPAAVVKPSARARELLYVDVLPDVARDGTQGVAAGRAQGGEAPGTVDSSPVPGKISAKRRWIMEQVARLGGGWMQSICRELKTTPATIRAMAAESLLVVEPRARRRDPLAGRKVLPSKPLPLNEEQAAALAAITSLDSSDARRSPAILLHGVTGSGKTEVYLQAIAAELAAGRGAIVLVPEIALTPQTVQRFASRFGGLVAVLHSALSDGERYDEWHRIRSGEARVVIGPRSAVFAPVKDLGLIVVDEEHDTSYKQDDTPRYNARDVAVMRAKAEGAKVVLGSATPSLETWVNAASGKYALASMTRRAGAGTLPSVRIVDMSEPGNRGAIFSRELLDAIRLRLDRGEQTILFLNRRGFSRSVRCASCGHVLECPGCGIPYTYHRADSCCRCHVCGGWTSVPDKCPECGAHALEYKGFGTQRAEAALAACFKRARILRMDADSTSRRRSHDDILGAFRRREADILVGTQMIAKGLDFPSVTLVGVLNADSSLSMPDFRAAERTFQLLSQVSGRAGRAELCGEAVIQTYDPASPTIRAAARGDYGAFAAMELKDREEAWFPPYCHLACVNMRSKDAGLVSDWATMYSRSLAKVDGLSVGDAVPSALEMADGWHRWQIVVRSERTSRIVRAWKWLVGERPAPNGLRVAIDIDAFNML